MQGKIQHYRELLIWQKGITLVKDIYFLTRKFPEFEKFGLTAQIQRAAVSVPSNIAEGQARQHSNEFRQFLYVVLGSLAELDTQTTIAGELGYINTNELKMLIAKIIELRKMVWGILSKLNTDH